MSTPPDDGGVFSPTPLLLTVPRDAPIRAEINLEDGG